MTVPMIDDFLFDATRPSLRIAPLQDPFPTLSSSSTRPSPLEPNAHVNIDDDANKLTGRRKALAQAKALDALEPNDWDALPTSKMNSDIAIADADTRPQSSRKRQKRQSYDDDQVADFVQLPKPPAKIKQDRPRPFRPVSVLTELHEPPPSAALFPPITPSVSQDGEDGLVSRDKSSKQPIDKRQGSARGKKSSERSISPSVVTRTYNRGRTKWTQEEIDCLIKGVTIYGTGRWKNILDHPDLHFREGRTPTDLKDRFRVCYPPNPKGKSAKPIPKKTESENDVKLLLPVASKEIPQTKDRPVQRARKRHWTEAEDAELEKGFRRHGYNWNAMVKDADLHFDGRSGGQIRDRFRLKFKNLYEGQDATHSANKATTDSGPQQREQFGQMPALPKESSNSTTQGEENENGEGNQGKTASKPSFSCSLLGGEDEDSRLSNSILHSDLDWDDNLTLAPLTWEDMATRPIFAFD